VDDLAAVPGEALKYQIQLVLSFLKLFFRKAKNKKDCNYLK